jgi:primosomal protein N' (replication factor Y) (superfamily II helicase)
VSGRVGESELTSSPIHQFTNSPTHQLHFVVLIRVAVPVPTLDLLTYVVAPDTPAPVVGARVIVPVGARTLTGIVVETDVGTDAALDRKELKSVQKVLDAGPFLPEDVVALARWTGEYYAGGAGAAITAVLPPKARGIRADAHKTLRVVSITAAGLELVGEADPDVGRAFKGRHSTKQLSVLEMLAGCPAGIPAPQLAAKGIAADTIARLKNHALVSVRHDRIDRDPFEAASLTALPVDASRRLTPEQAEALSRLRTLAQSGTFRVALLHGVTGSGKTEIYLRLSAEMLAAGRRVLMLVPEIALTPAIAALFRQAFGDRVAIQHSGLSDGERHDQWQRIRRGDVTVVVGTRSAIFSPLEQIGLIIVDEEHESSYKQEESPRYNGRDVAIVRAQRAGALVVLGSATPSMETYHNAIAGRFERIVLQRRILDRPLAAVSVVDMREEYAHDGPDVVLSRPLTAAIHERLAAGEQTLLLLNRRGFATSIFCRQCAGTIDCPNCSVSLVVHGEGSARRARCHYCNYTARVPTKCAACAAPYLEQAGFGTERVEAEVRRLCPAARVARLDRDAVRRKGSLTALLSRFRDGEIDVLVGTQMIAKGHDFPNVTLVGVISADVGLGVADFRASERTFQLLTQVAGRAGRGEQLGAAIVQTLYPDHYSIQMACRQDYPAFYERELQFRRAMRYPPLVAMINTVVRSRTFSGAMDDAAGVAQTVRESDAERRELTVLGPAPPPLGRLRGEYRAQVLIKGANRRRMREALLAAIRRRPEIARRTTVDVDPLSVL